MAKVALNNAFSLILFSCLVLVFVLMSPCSAQDKHGHINSPAVDNSDWGEEMEPYAPLEGDSAKDEETSQIEKSAEPLEKETAPETSTQAVAADADSDVVSDALEPAPVGPSNPASVTESNREENRAVEKKQPESAKTTVKKSRPRQKTMDERIDDLRGWVEDKGSYLIFIWFLAIVFVKLSDVLCDYLVRILTRKKDGTELKKRADTLGSVFRYCIWALILFTVVLDTLKVLGIDLAPLLAGAGVLGLAIGFGAQNLVKDMISGFFILLEDQIRVGDVVQIADKSGVVEKLTLRMVILRDISHNVHFIPSGEVTVVTNMTKEYSGYLFDVGVAYKEDVDQVIEVMKAVDEELRTDEEYSVAILEPLEVMGLEQFADSAVIIRARTKTRPIMQWRVGREFKRRLKKRFDALGIEIPYPHVTVYPGVDKAGRSPEFNLALEKGVASGFEPVADTVPDTDAGFSPSTGHRSRIATRTGQR